MTLLISSAVSRCSGEFIPTTSLAISQSGVKILPSQMRKDTIEKLAVIPPLTIKPLPSHTTISSASGELTMREAAHRDSLEHALDSLRRALIHYSTIIARIDTCTAQSDCIHAEYDVLNQSFLSLSASIAPRPVKFEQVTVYQPIEVEKIKNLTAWETIEYSFLGLATGYVAGKYLIK